MELRYYQKEAVEAVWNHISTKETNPCIVLPTGTGKSLVIAKIASDAVTKWNGRVLILAHVKELLEQNAEKIKRICPELKIGIYSAGLKRKDRKESVIVAGIQSIAKHACDFDPFDIIIIDECHLIPPDGEGLYRTFLADEHVINPNVRIIGLTATPYRLKGGTICKPENMLNEICYDAGLNEMIAKGYLSPIVPKSPASNPDFSTLHIKAGEFSAEETDEMMTKPGIVADACREIAEQTKECKSVLIFCTSISHCNKVKERLEEYTGEEVCIVTGDTPCEERAEILKRFKGETVKSGLFAEEKKPIKYLCNVSVLTTGFDAPNTDCVAMLRPTASPGLLVQIAGRGLRLSPQTGKTKCLFLDFGGNIMRHGPLDAIRVKETKSNGHKGEMPMKRCPKCGTLTEIQRAVCPECGFEFPKPEATHGRTASEDALLSGQVTKRTCNVQSTCMRVWSKRGAEESDPKTVCIEYEIGLGAIIRQWICPEHTGYARDKFVKWWIDSYADDDGFLPSTSQEVVDAFDRGLMKTAMQIEITHIAGEKFDSVSKVFYKEDSTEEQQFESIEEEIPF